MRERRRTRTPGRIVKRKYALRLRCRAAGATLRDVGRYRHPAPTCDAFIAATPDARRRYTKGHDKRVRGHSYPQDWYEDADRRSARARSARVDDVTITEVVRRYHDRPPRVDSVTLARISHERERRRGAWRRRGTSRPGSARWHSSTRGAGRTGAGRAQRLSSAEVVAYLRSLPSLWADSGPDGRQALATALFARTDVLGFERMEYELTPDAIELGLGRHTAGRVRDRGKER